MCWSVWACVVSSVFEHARGRVGAFPCLRRNSDTGTLCVEQLSSSALTPIVALLQKSGPRESRRRLGLGGRRRARDRYEQPSKFKHTFGDVCWKPLEGIIRVILHVSCAA